MNIEIDLKSLESKAIIIKSNNARFLKKFISIFIILISIFYLLNANLISKKIIHNNTDNFKYDLVLPINNKDINKFIRIQDKFKKFIKYDKIVMIGPNEIKNFFGNTIIRKIVCTTIKWLASLYL